MRLALPRRSGGACWRAELVRATRRYANRADHLVITNICVGAHATKEFFGPVISFSASKRCDRQISDNLSPRLMSDPTHLFTRTAARRTAARPVHRGSPRPASPRETCAGAVRSIVAVSTLRVGIASQLEPRAHERASARQSQAFCYFRDGRRARVPSKDAAALAALVDAFLAREAFHALEAIAAHASRSPTANEQCDLLPIRSAA